MQERRDIPFSELTTLRLGGPASRLLEASSEEELFEALESVDGPVLLIAGGSNLVISDEGFAGSVIRIANRGMSFSRDGDTARVAVAAGQPWDDVVTRSVEEGLAGIECLSGIPGSTGATPIQNVGAYGQEVASTIASVRVYDRASRAVVELGPEQCGFAYRSSMFKRSDRYVVLGVNFILKRSSSALPVRYAELARSLSVDPGASAPLDEVRVAVLALRRSKGMVLDADDPDSVSAGSFFVNPLLLSSQFADLEHRVADEFGEDVRPPAWPELDGRVKTSAAWLIERAGFHRGYGEGRVGVSSKHTLALINRGMATTEELLALARELRDGVRQRFGVDLRVEPTLVGVEL